MIFGFAHKKGLAFALQGRLGSFWDPSGIHVAFQEHFLWFVLLVLPLWPFVPDLPRFAKKCFINYMIWGRKGHLYGTSNWFWPALGSNWDPYGIP